jgi:cell wall-associated NlpC family hydrolase
MRTTGRACATLGAVAAGAIAFASTAQSAVLPRSSGSTHTHTALAAAGSRSLPGIDAVSVQVKVAKRVIVSRPTKAIAYAKRQQGKPYRWGAQGPDAYDCSGLTQRAYQSAGIQLPRTSAAQATVGHRIPPSAGIAALKPGDLVFWAYNPADLRTVHHVAIYLGGGKVIQAPQTGDVVKISAMWLTGYAGAVRLS